MEEIIRGYRKTRTGVVVSDKMDKTVVVAISTKVRHPLYGKMVNRTRKFKAHDEENQCGIGDTVRIMETRPISKDKRWRVVEIIEKGSTYMSSQAGLESEMADVITGLILLASACNAYFMQKMERRESGKKAAAKAKTESVKKEEQA